MRLSYFLCYRTHGEYSQNHYNISATQQNINRLLLVEKSVHLRGCTQRRSQADRKLTEVVYCRLFIKVALCGVRRWIWFFFDREDKSHYDEDDDGIVHGPQKIHSPARAVRISKIKLMMKITSHVCRMKRRVRNHSEMSSTLEQKFTFLTSTDYAFVAGEA